jgi:type I restriction enzyme S subunit
MYPDYFNWLFHTEAFADEFYKWGHGIVDDLWTTRWSEMKQIVIPIPEFMTQTVIAAYLDEKCGTIDEIIAEAKASIEEYKAWKSSVIFEAVTKGLDQNAEMKDSGVEWIGKVPRHWRISRIKNECTNMDYLREPISAENRVNVQGTYDYYGASGVIDKIDDFNVDDTVLLIGEDGANLVYRNLPLVYRASGKFWVNNHAHILKVSVNNDYDFVAYMLEAGDYTNYITGSAQPKLSQFNLMRFPIPMPPLREQHTIATHLNKKCAAIDGIIAEKEALIADMEAYKKSLIFETVTGKRKVC